MRILLVEDEKKVADIIVRGLKAERFAVDVYHDGQSAWEAANIYNYDLIILDLMLPGLSGTEILERVRRKNQSVPILILTARDGMADKVKNFRRLSDQAVCIRRTAGAGEGVAAARAGQPRERAAGGRSGN